MSDSSFHLYKPHSPAYIVRHHDLLDDSAMHTVKLEECRDAETRREARNHERIISFVFMIKVQ